ncbi:MAG: hypothetical protein CMO66_07150 [Verrucomicrobiales bacterium]|nr:hypothetical protein [Verrucomicrobiales bacterium]
MDTGPMPPMSPSPEQIATALFAESLQAQITTCMMLLGRARHPALDKPVTDAPKAKRIIDQLELLDKDSTGLGLEEIQMIRDSLHQLRMAYVETVGSPPEDSLPTSEEPEDSTDDSATADPAENHAPEEPASPSPGKPVAEAGDDEDDDEPRKRFVKKYD